MNTHWLKEANRAPFSMVPAARVRARAEIEELRRKAYLLNLGGVFYLTPLGAQQITIQPPLGPEEVAANDEAKDAMIVIEGVYLRLDG